jgi:hypothetical protein
MAHPGRAKPTFAPCAIALERLDNVEGRASDAHEKQLGDTVPWSKSDRFNADGIAVPRRD